MLICTWNDDEIRNRSAKKDVRLITWNAAREVEQGLVPLDGCESEFVVRVTGEIKPALDERVVHAGFKAKQHHAARVLGGIIGGER